MCNCAQLNEHYPSSKSLPSRNNARLCETMETGRQHRSGCSFDRCGHCASWSELNWTSQAQFSSGCRGWKFSFQSLEHPGCCVVGSSQHCICSFDFERQSSGCSIRDICAIPSRESCPARIGKLEGNLGSFKEVPQYRNLLERTTTTTLLRLWSDYRDDYQSSRDRKIRKKKRKRPKKEVKATRLPTTKKPLSGDLCYIK